MNMSAAVYSDVKFGWIVASGTMRETDSCHLQVWRGLPVASRGHGGAPDTTPRVQTLPHTKARSA